MEKHLSVLFVGDSESDRELVLQEFRNGGCPVSHRQIGTAEQMRAALADGHWNLIIADYLYPALDTPSVLSILLKSEVDIPVIVVSGEIGGEAAIVAMKSGIGDYIIRSNLSRLIPAVERELGRARERREQRENEQKRRQTQMQMEVILSSTPNIIWVSDAESRLLYVNRAFSESVGMAPERMIGRSCCEIWHDVNGPLSDCPHEEIMKTKQAITREIYDHVWKKHFQISAYPVFDERGVIARVVIILRDIDEKKRMEAELKKAEELYRTISLHSQTGIAIVQEGKLVFVNPYLLEFFGYPEEELLGKTMVDLIVPEDRNEVRRNALQMLKGKSTMPYTYRTMGADGQVRWVVETVSSVTYQGKRAILGNIMDVTARKELEKQLMDAREMLIRAEKLSAVGTLAGGISHEILNPLNIISLNLQMLGLEDWPPEKTREMLDVCAHQVERIEKIAWDMNIFARVSKKELSAANINGLIESVLNLIGPKLRLAHITIERQLQPDLPEIMLDVNNIWQVITNLIGNAADAMENKEEKILRVRTGIRATPEGDVMRMVFADTGVGIDEEMLPRIFDPFFTTKEPGKGTGLGLSVSAGIIQEHGGMIRAENNAWGGASFIVELPLNQKG